MGNQPPEKSQSSPCTTGQVSEDPFAPVRALGEHDELATAVLAYLIHSGQVTLRPSSDDNAESLYQSQESEDELRSKIAYCIKDNDICQLIQQSSSFECRKITHWCQKNLAGCVRQRETTMSNRRGGFSPSTKAAMQSKYLPNSNRKVAQFSAKLNSGFFSQDGTMFVSSCQDQHIRLYNVTHNTLKCFQDVTCKDVGYCVVDTSMSSDNSHFIYSSWHECIYLCSVGSDDEMHVQIQLKPPDVMRFCPFSIRFSPDNAHVLAGGNDGCIYLYDQTRAERTVRFQTSCGSDDKWNYDVNAVSYADNSSHVVYSGGDDTLCLVWDLRLLDEDNPRPVAGFAGHGAGITYIDSKGDGRYLISNSKDQSIKLWDIRQPSDYGMLKHARDTVEETRWDYRFEAPPRDFGKQGKTEGDPSLMTYRGHQVLRSLLRCHFSPAHTTGQRYVYTGCSSGKLIVYDVLSGHIVSQLQGHTDAVRDVSWHPYEQVICSSSWDGTHAWWEYEPEMKEI